VQEVLRRLWGGKTCGEGCLEGTIYKKGLDWVEINPFKIHLTAETLEKLPIRTWYVEPAGKKIVTGTSLEIWQCSQTISWTLSFKKDSENEGRTTGARSVRRYYAEQYANTFNKGGGGGPGRGEGNKREPVHSHCKN